jgi:hypothetical protein
VVIDVGICTPNLYFGVFSYLAIIAFRRSSTLSRLTSFVHFHRSDLLHKWFFMEYSINGMGLSTRAASIASYLLSPLKN